MIPSLDRNTIKTAIRGAYEIDAWARDEPIDRFLFEEHGRRIGSSTIWRLVFPEGSVGRIHSMNLYTLDAFEIVLAELDVSKRTNEAYPATDALVSMLAYNTGEPAPTPHMPGAIYDGETRIDLNRPCYAQIIERQRELLSRIERDEPGITRESTTRARAAYRWVRDTL